MKSFRVNSSGAVIRLLRVATALTNTRLILQLQLMTMCAVVGWWCSGDERGVQAGATVPLALGGLGQFSSITRRARAEDISSTSLTARRSRLVHGSWIYWARLDRTASFGNWRHWRTRRTRRRRAVGLAASDHAGTPRCARQRRRFATAPRRIGGGSCPGTQGHLASQRREPACLISN